MTPRSALVISFCRLAIKNQRLVSKCLDLSLIVQARQLLDVNLALQDYILQLKSDLFPTREEQEEAGVTHYIWRTVGDDKVRPSHAANDGKVFAWSNPPPTGHPGDDYNCRCQAEPYYPLDGSDIDDPPLNPVYPELLIIPLLRIAKLYNLWSDWVRNRNVSENWQLSSTKSATRWRNRIEKGDWTPNKITQTIRNGDRYRVINERTGGPATRYELNGQYVVRDDTTGDILQLSGPDHIPKNF